MGLSWNKKLSALLKEITSRNGGEFYRLNCLHSFRTENKLRSHEKARKYKYFCEIVTPSQNDNVLQLNQYMKSDTMPYIIYANLEFFIKK